MSRPRTEELEAQLDLDGPRRLVGALLRTAVTDASSTSTRGWGRAERRRKARQWLEDERTVCAWLELVGLPRTVYRRLLDEAGLTGERP